MTPRELKNILVDIRSTDLSLGCAYQLKQCGSVHLGTFGRIAEQGEYGGGDYYFVPVAAEEYRERAERIGGEQQLSFFAIEYHKRKRSVDLRWSVVAER